ncbi:serine/threonine-protein kinase pim-1-like isoform X2 [Cinclus cinclus]|uniref:serine/threonine-protein kinase pim-1-like isoform X2 n=1 Tax=Cinclus cinclus TaxID=127875 RepID=UPI002E165896
MIKPAFSVLLLEKCFCGKHRGEYNAPSTSKEYADPQGKLKYIPPEWICFHCQHGHLGMIQCPDVLLYHTVCGDLPVSSEDIIQGWLFFTPWESQGGHLASWHTANNRVGRVQGGTRASHSCISIEGNTYPSILLFSKIQNRLGYLGAALSNLSVA